MQPRQRLPWIAALLVVASAIVPACSGDVADGSGSSSGDPTSGPGAGPGQGGGDTGQGGSGSITVGVGSGAGGDEQGSLVIEPQNPSLDVEYGVAGQTVQFTATRGGSDVNGVAWFLSTPEAGTITPGGLFTSNGMAGGEITVGARLDGDTATTTLRLNLHVVENPAGLTPSDQDILTNPDPGAADPAWTLWYPYGGTVFPRGVPAPAWQSATSAQMPSAYYLKIEGADVLYEGFLAPEGGAQRARPSREAWDAIGTATDGGDMTVSIAKLVAGQKVGPIEQTIKIARGKLKGTIYYNTYNSPLAGNTGAVMRIRGDLSTPEVFLGQCKVCHSVAADGSTAATADHGGGGGTFDLLANPDTPPNVWTDAELAAFAGLYPKGGEVLVTNGTPGGFWPPNTPGSSFSATSTLRMRDGTLVPNSGIEPYYAQTPVFSHDGSMLAFYDRPAGGGTGALALMDFDLATKTFSNYRVIGTPQAGRHHAWPAFTPDGKWVLYQDGTGDDLATWNANTGRIVAVNVETAELKQLENLNSDAFAPGAGNPTRDHDLNFEPTLLPLASGGYYWVMFTSRRTHGNTLTSGRNDTKRLWVAAFDLDAPAGVDPTHPPFYVEGQEQAGNSRGFWALDPCRQDGEGCESGDQCCNGFCNPSADDANVFVCGQPDGSCSDEFEACDTAADCCDPSMECINGRCAQDDPVPN
jgi:hypothetical protein